MPDGELSFKDGCFELIGPWREMGRWRRHIYQGVADTIERKHDLPKGTMLDTPWDELDAELQKLWLWGTGDEHITFTWRQGGVGPEVWRPVRGHHSRAARQAPQLAEQDAAAAARKVHAGDALHRVRWRSG